MNTLPFHFAGADLVALGSGALYWPSQNLLVISDLHLGKSERIARRSGQMLPPYEVMDTLSRLEEALRYTVPETVICLGDCFDDLTAGENLREEHTLWLNRLMAGRQWIWIEGNHDPGPLEFGGTHLAQYSSGPLTFRHIALDDVDCGEVSGHYHPKANVPTRGRTVSRPCFLVDDRRLILPAFGTYTGGLRSNSENLCDLMSVHARAIVTGTTPVAVPMPRRMTST